MCKLIRAGITVLFLLCCNHALADLNITGNVASHFSDNANQEPEDSADEFQQSFGMGLQYTHESKRYVADLDYVLTHSRFLKDEFQNETNFTGVGSVNYHLLPTNFDWFASYERDLFLNSSNVANTPSNRSSQTLFSTGPRYHYEFTNSTMMELGATYSESINGSAIGSDSSRASTDISFTHQVNPITTLNVGFTYVDVLEFEGGEEYVQRNYHFGAQRLLKNGQLNVNVGYNQVDRELTDDVSDRSFDISFEHRVFNNVVELRALNEVTDSTVGLSVRDLIDSGFDNIETNFSAVDIVKRRRYEFSISRNVIDRATISFFAYLDEEDFVTQEQDEEDRGASISIDFAVNSAVAAEFMVGREYTEYLSQPSFGENETTFYDLEFNWAHTTKMTSSYEISFTERVNQIRPASDYEEIEVRVALNYQFL